MPAATASGANPTPNGNIPKSRDHNQGNQDRKYTVEQKTAVIRVRKCAPTAFYEILGCEKSVTDAEIKKAYRKLSLLTHPDKNGYDGADEAFKMVSRAFQILSDAEKKERYDRFGGDPDNRFGPSGGGAAASSPFSGFSPSPGSGRGPMFDAEISPEELFNRFFGGGGMGGPFGKNPIYSTLEGKASGILDKSLTSLSWKIGGGGGMFDSGPQFVFNLGGGPGFRVHQFGGGQPRRRPRTANGTTDSPPPQSAMGALSNLLPLLILFVLPLLSSLFSSTLPSGPSIHFQPGPPNTEHRTSHRLNIDYYLNPSDISELSPRKLNELDKKAETQYVTQLQYECQIETRTRNRMFEEAQGWFTQDEERMRQARAFEMRSCNELDRFGFARGGN